MKLFEVILLALMLLVCMSMGAIIIMLCWNHVIPYVFKLPTIGFTQAFALSLIMKAMHSDLISFNYKKEN